MPTKVTATLPHGRQTSSSGSSAHRPPDGARAERRPDPRRLALLSAIGALLVGAALLIHFRYQSGRPAREHVRQGIALAAAGKLTEAEGEWRRALQLDPQNRAPQLLLSRLYLDTDRAERALPLLEGLRTAAPRTPHALCTLAEAYARTEQNSQGMEAARQAVVLEPNCARAHALLGIFQGNAHDMRGAIAELSRAAALDPSDAKITLSLTQAQMDGADFLAVERTLRTLTTRAPASIPNPSLAQAHYLLGMAYARRTPTPENRRTAITAFQRAVRLDPSLTGANAEIGRLLLLSGDARGAIRTLEDLRRRGANTKETCFNLAAAYRKVGDTRGAARLSQEAKRLADLDARRETLRKRLAVEPTNGRVALELAQAALAAGDLPEAAPLLDAVLQVHPRDPRALQAAITLYDRLGERETANTFRRRLTASGNTGDPDAQR